MDRIGLPRRLTALVAAYGLALQMLLAAVVALPSDGAFASITCRHGRAAAPERQAPIPRHGPGCTLCSLACGGATALPSGAPAVVAMVSPGEPVLPPRLDAAVVPAIARAGFARAPPA